MKAIWHLPTGDVPCMIAKRQQGQNFSHHPKPPATLYMICHNGLWYRIHKTATMEVRPPQDYCTINKRTNARYGVTVTTEAGERMP